MIELTDRAPLRAYFPDTRDTLISACLEGHLGRAVQGPDCGLLLAGDFAFLAGNPAQEALAWLDENKKGYLILTGTEPWLRLAEAYPRSPRRATRYAFEDEPAWDRQTLLALRGSLPPGFRLMPMDAELFRQCRQEDDLRDLCSSFPDMAAFDAHGAAALAVYEGRAVAGASAYAWDSRGIEVEIDTMPAFRRRGLATACGAGLVLACIDKGLRVHWDAASPISVRLATKLGFGRPRPYEVIEWQ